MSYGIGKVSFQEKNTDVYDRLKTTSPYTQFEGKFTYGIEEKLYKSTVSSGTSTFDTNSGAWTLSTTNVTSSVLRESYNYMVHHAGKAQQIYLCATFGTSATNCTKMVGYYDDNDGMYFVQTSIFGVGVRSSVTGSVVDTIIQQSSWNLDKLDGTGNSGIVLDTTKPCNFVIDFRFSGAGYVRFGIMTKLGTIYCHEIDYTNSGTFIKNPNLPLRYQISCTGTSGTSSLKQYISSVVTEADGNSVGSCYSAAGNALTNAPVGVWTPIVSVRVENTLNGLPFRGHQHIYRLTSLVDNNNNALFGVFENSTLTGAVWTSVGSPSACSFDNSAIAMTGGTLRYTAYNAKTSGKSNFEDQLIGYAGTSFTIAAQGVGGISRATASFNWRENI